MIKKFLIAIALTASALVAAPNTAEAVPTTITIQNLTDTFTNKPGTRRPIWVTSSYNQNINPVVINSLTPSTCTYNTFTKSVHFLAVGTCTIEGITLSKYVGPGTCG
jgi:hypothetical protein